MRNGFAWLALAACLVLVVATDAHASRIDTWQGLFNRTDVTDTNIFPHTMLDYDNATYLIYTDPAGGASGTRVGADNEQRYLAAVVGTIWEKEDGPKLSAGCSFGDERSINPVAHYNDPHLRRPATTKALGSPIRSLLGEGLSSPLTVQDQIQGSIAYQPSSDLQFGLSYAHGENEALTTVDPLGGGDTETSGRSVDYSAYTLSGAFDLERVEIIKGIQAALSYTTGGQEEVGPGVTGGAGDLSGYGANVQVDFGYVNDWSTIVQFGIADFTSDFTFEVPDGFTGTVPMNEQTHSMWTIDVGGQYDFDNGSVGATFGVMSAQDEFFTNDDAFYESIRVRDTNDMVPTCGVTTSLNVTDHWSLDAGAIGSHEKVETRTTRRTTDDVEQITVDTRDMTMRYRFGVTYQNDYGNDANGDGRGDTEVTISGMLDPGASTQNPLRGDSSDPWLGGVMLGVSF